MNKRIEFLRKEILKMSMEEFGKQLKISKSAVNQIEKGINNPSDQTIALICSKFNVSEEWLRTGKEPTQIKKSEKFADMCLDIGAHDPKAREAIMKYYELSEDDKRLWWGFIERFMK